MWVGRQAWTWRVVTFDHAPVHSARSDIAPRVHVTVGLLPCRMREAGRSPRNSASACTKRASWAGSTATATSSCHQKRCCFAIGTATSPCHRRRGSKMNWRVIHTCSNVLSFSTWLARGGGPRHQRRRHPSLGPSMVPSCKATCSCRSRGRLVHGCSKRRLVDPPFGRSS